MLVAFSTNPQPESVPINALVAVEGTPMEEKKPVEIWEMIECCNYKNHYARNAVRLSGKNICREGQAMCFCRSKFILLR
jgi:biotin synthase